MAPVTKKNGKRSISTKEVSNKKAKTAKPVQPVESESESEPEIDVSEGDLDSSEDELDQAESESEDELDQSESEDELDKDEMDVDAEEEDEEAGSDSEPKARDPNKPTSKEQHAEQKKTLMERKLQRKSGVQIQQIKHVWEKLRVKNPPLPKEIRDKLSNEIWELAKDCVKDLVLKHDASRVVQTLVKYSTKERRDQVVQALKGNFYVLATSAYGKYLLVKLLHYGSKESRELIISELHGSLRKLMRHREGAYVVEDLYVLYATNEQKQQMIREFWGSEYAVFKKTEKDLTIEKVCESSVEKRNVIARNLVGTITASVEKGSTGFQILHAAMREYVRIANDKETAEFTELLQDQFAELVHTPEGCEVACTLIAKASAKERKQIVRSLKDHASKLIKNEHGNLVLITLFLTVDDTVLIAKSFAPAVVESLAELVVDKYARRPFIYLLLGLDGKYFNPLVKKELQKYIDFSQATSKKPQETRRQELLSKFAPVFVEGITKSYNEILKENIGCQFIGEVLVNDELFEQLNDEAKYKEAVDVMVTAFKGDISEEDHPINKPFSVRLLKSLIQGGKWNNKTKTVEPLKSCAGLGSEFAARFYDEIIDSNLLEWINNANSSFVVVAIYESLLANEPKNGFFKALKKCQKKIETDENKGAQLLLKLLK